MRPQELETLYNFLDTMQHEVAESLGNHILENVHQVQSIILHRLENTRCLGDLELQDWTAGHGFPVYNKFQYPVDFHWDWDVIEFERLYSKYFNPVHPVSAGFLSHSVYSTPIRYISPPPNTSANRSPYGSANIDRIYPESGRPVIMYGATFANTNKCLEFLDSLTDCDLALLEDETIQLEGDSHFGIRRIWGRNMDSHFERVTWASWTDLKTIESTEIEERNRQTKTEAKQHPSKHVRSWEDVKCIDPNSLPARPMRDNYSRWSEETPTHAFPNEPSHDTPRVTIRPATPYSIFDKPAEEQYILSGSLLERVQHPGQGSERRSQTVQPRSNRGIDQSTFTKQPEPHCVTYLQAPSVHHQLAIAHERDSSFSAGREGKRKVQIKDAKSMPESEGKKLDRTYSKMKSQIAIDSALAAHEIEKAKERSRQNATQQATYFEDLKQQTPSFSSAQKAIKRSEHTPESVDEQALDPRHTTNSVNPNAYQTQSFQELTRLFIRPGAATRPSSHHGDLKDLTYAEDSLEDAPRAALGSWRDV
jgi:hypothetical protein